MNWKFYVWAAAAMTTAITFAATVGRLDGAITGVILLASWASVFNMGYHSVNDGHDGPAQGTTPEEDPVHGHQTYRPELDEPETDEPLDFHGVDPYDNPHASVLRVIRERSGNPRIIADLTTIPDHIVAKTLKELSTAGLIAQNDPTRPWYALDDVLTVRSTSDV